MREEVRGEPVGRAARGVLKGLTAGKRLLDYVVRADCEAGTRFTKRIGLPDSVGRVVLQVHERWDGKGLPFGLGGEALELGARVIATADQVEIFHRLDGREATHAMLRSRAGGWFDPAVVEACERCAADILAELETGSVWDAVLGAEPAPPVTLPDWRVDDLAEAVADVVDLKSPYFLGHSRGVAELAEGAAGALGLGENEPPPTVTQASSTISAASASRTSSGTSQAR